MGTGGTILQHWRRIGGVVWAAEPKGSNDGDRLLEYNPRKVNQSGYLPLFTPWTLHGILGTVVTYTNIGYTCFYLTLCTSFAYDWWGMDDSSRRHGYQLLSHLLEGGAVKLSAIVIFPLGLFTSLVITRSISAFEHYNDLGKASIDVAVNCATLGIPKDGSEFDERLLWIRSELARLIMLGHRLTMVHVQTLDQQITNADPAAPEKAEMADLLHEKLLNVQEMRALSVCSKKYVMAYSWLASMMGNCMTHPSIDLPPPVLGRVHDKCCHLITTANHVAESVQVQVPYAYVSLIIGMVRVYLTFVAIQHGLFMGAHGRDFYLNADDGTYSDIANSGWETLACYIWIVVLSIFFNGLLELHGMLHNPFKKRPLHVAVHQNEKKLEDAICLIFYKEKGELPATIRSPFDVELPEDLYNYSVRIKEQHEGTAATPQADFGPVVNASSRTSGKGNRPTTRFGRCHGGQEVSSDGSGSARHSVII